MGRFSRGNFFKSLRERLYNKDKMLSTNSSRPFCFIFGLLFVLPASCLAFNLKWDALFCHPFDVHGTQIIVAITRGTLLGSTTAFLWCCAGLNGYCLLGTADAPAAAAKENVSNAEQQEIDKLIDSRTGLCVWWREICCVCLLACRCMLCIEIGGREEENVQFGAVLRLGSRNSSTRSNERRRRRRASFECFNEQQTNIEWNKNP